MMVEKTHEANDAVSGTVKIPVEKDQGGMMPIIDGDKKNAVGRKDDGGGATILHRQVAIAVWWSL
jgi:hypothetical protein